MAVSSGAAKRLISPVEIAVFCSSPVGIELVGAIKHFKRGKKIPRGFLQSFLKIKKKNLAYIMQ